MIRNTVLLILCLWINCGMSMLYTDQLRVNRTVSSSQLSITLLNNSNIQSRLKKFRNIKTMCKTKDVRAFNIATSPKLVGINESVSEETPMSPIILWNSAKLLLAEYEEECIMTLDPSTLTAGSSKVQCSTFRSYISDLQLINADATIQMEFVWFCDVNATKESKLAAWYQNALAALILSSLTLIILLFLATLFYIKTRQLEKTVNPDLRYRLPGQHTLQSHRLNDETALSSVIQRGQSGTDEQKENETLIGNQSNDVHSDEESYIEMGPGVTVIDPPNNEEDYMDPSAHLPSDSQELYVNCPVRS